MHRHGYKGKKLSREAAQRKAVIRGLAASLIDHGSIETTLPKAKELVPYVEKVITKAKVGTLHSRRQVISSIRDLTTVDILYTEILPAVSARNSGYLRIEKTKLRRGDSAQMARVSFVDDLAAAQKKAQDTEKKEAPKDEKKVPAEAKK